MPTVKQALPLTYVGEHQKDDFWVHFPWEQE